MRPRGFPGANVEPAQWAENEIAEVDEQREADGGLAGVDVSGAGRFGPVATSSKGVVSPGSMAERMRSKRVSGIRRS